MTATDPTVSQQRLADLIREAGSVVALTGAGMSTPSGIPDFRSPGGLWTQVNPMEVAHIEVWRTEPQRFWEFYRHRLDIPDTYAPNDAHRAFARLQAAGKLDGLITQNIDGLHQKAGVDDAIEVHGSVRKCVCACGVDVAREDAKELFADDGVPYCPECEQPLKPDVVLFGEMLPEAAIERAYQLCQDADLLICAGSSLTVYPVAELPVWTRHNGGKVAVVARECAYSPHADVVLDGDIDAELAAVADLVESGR